MLFRRDPQFLIESWTSKLYQRLHASSPIAIQSMSFDETSVVGPPVWSETWFDKTEKEVEEVAISNMSEPSENEDAVEQHLMLPDDEYMPDDGVGADVVRAQDSESSSRIKRKITVDMKTLSGMSIELCKANQNPHTLITSLEYGTDLNDQGLQWEQPFEVIVHPQVPFMCDLHAHLCSSEIIGLLAGKWDSELKILYIQVPFPCTATERKDDGSTDVELDPIAEFQVREIIAQEGMIVVGWYHSHPKFRPDPSVCYFPITRNK